MQFKEIPTKDIVILENHRLVIDKAEIKSLAANIHAVGLQQPIGVYPAENGKHELRFGQRRLMACKLLGHKTIQCLIKPRRGKTPRDVEDRKQMLIVNITENMQRVNPSFPEFGRAIEQLHEVCKMTLADISKQLGKSPSEIEKIYQTWIKLPKKHRAKVRFMEKRGRTGGGVGAHVAHTILNIKKKHGLSKKNEDLLFNRVNKQNMSEDNLQTVGMLLKDGVGFDQAMQCMGKYKMFYVEVLADEAQVEDYKKELGCPNTGLVFKRILYGNAPPLDKPKFITV